MLRLALNPMLVGVAEAPAAPPPTYKRPTEEQRQRLEDELRAQGFGTEQIRLAMAILEDESAGQREWSRLHDELQKAVAPPRPPPLPIPHFHRNRKARREAAALARRR